MVTGLLRIISGLAKKIQAKLIAQFHLALNLDYSFPLRFAPAFFWIGPPAQALFSYYESSCGYWDNKPIRVIAFFLQASIAFLPRDKSKWSKWHVGYWELCLFFVFPFMNTLWMLENDVNSYYFSAQSINMFILGALTKVWMIPAHFLVCALTTVAFCLFKDVGFSDPLIQTSISAQMNALFAAVSAGFLMTSMEGYHRQATDAKLALAQAEAENIRAKEIKASYEELKKREELIRVFVRPSVVEEIHNGKDPSKFDPILRNLAILFCDIRDFTLLTEILNPYEKQTFLNQYFTMMTHPIVKNGGEVDKIMGDCVMGIFPDGDSAIRASIDMRLQLQDFNQKMFNLNQPKIRNGIGIAKGEVMLGNFGSYEKMDRTVIGEAVNIASRLESKTKMYNLEVVVTEDVIRDLKPGSQHYRWIDVVQVKGSTRHLKLYEIYGHQPEEVREYKDRTRDMLEKALTIYFQKGFKDAQRLFRAMLEQVPPHRHVPNDLMDNILMYYIDHCDAWINDPNGTWEMIEKWDGVHVFHEK